MKKKKVRRSQHPKTKDIDIYYCNLNGAKSKQQSIQQIVEKINQAVLVFCETKLPDDKWLQRMLPNYSINSRATKTGKSGIAVAVKNQTFQSVLDVTTSENRDILVTRISHGTTTFRMILGYGPQESADVDTRENFFTELEIDVSNSKLKNGR